MRSFRRSRWLGYGLAGAPETPERPEGGGPPTGRPFVLVLGGLGIDEIDGDSLDPDFLDIGPAGYGASGVVVVRVARIARIGSVDTFVESREDLSGLEGGHIKEATPYFSGGEAAGCKTRDDAKIVRAALKGAPEVGVRQSGGCNDGARGEDEFIAEDIGADQAEAGGEEGETACFVPLCQLQNRGMVERLAGYLTIPLAIKAVGRGKLRRKKQKRTSQS